MSWKREAGSPRPLTRRTSCDSGCRARSGYGLPLRTPCPRRSTRSCGHPLLTLCHPMTPQSLDTSQGAGSSAETAGSSEAGTGVRPRRAGVCGSLGGTPGQDPRCPIEARAARPTQPRSTASTYSAWSRSLLDASKRVPAWSRLRSRPTSHLGFLDLHQRRHVPDPQPPQVPGPVRCPQDVAAPARTRPRRGPAPWSG
jgi:hypothetical protein